MMVWSINLFVLAIGILIVGMFKPQFILFWMEKPARVPIIILSVILFMIGATMFGQASLDKKKEVKKPVQKTEKTIDKSNDPTDIDVVKEVK
jgi:predicted membrane channel-forming protein YqfA (hemolysin III family)